MMYVLILSRDSRHIKWCLQVEEDTDESTSTPSVREDDGENESVPDLAKHGGS